MIPYYIFWLLIIGLSFYPRRNLILIIILATLFAGIRGLDVSRDTEAFYEVFVTTNNFESVYDNVLSGVRVEYSFRLFSYLINYFNLSFTALLIVIAFCSISINFWQFRKHSLFFPISTVMYLSNFYLLHEMVQIRAGLAAAFFLVAVSYLQKSFLKYSSICVLAALMHTSFLISLPIYFFINNSIKKLNLLIIFAIFIFILNILGVQLIKIDLVVGDLLERIHPYLSFKINAYTNPIALDQYEHKIGFLNYLRIIFVLFLFYSINNIKITNINNIKYFQVYLLGIIIYYLIFDYSAISSRLSDIFFTVEPLVVSFLFYYLINDYVEPKRRCIKIAIFTIFIFLMLILLSRNLQIFNPYEII
jgi:hypothetical protein